jgi:hypothetical protein
MGAVILLSSIISASHLKGDLSVFIAENTVDRKMPARRLAIISLLSSAVSVFQCLLGAVSPTPKSTRPNRCLGGAKPVEHLCPICGGRFLQTTDLAVHLTKIHGIKAEVVEAEIASAAAAALPNSSDDNSVDEGFCAAMENATSSNSSSGGIHRLRSNSDLDLHASPALSVK